MNKYCPNCGKENSQEAKFCYSCGNTFGVNQAPNPQAINYGNEELKSKIVAGLLGIFLGYLGVHNFYLGHTGKGVAQLLLTLIGWILCFTGPIVAVIWSFIEAIMCFTGSMKDSNGRPLKD